MNNELLTLLSNRHEDWVRMAHSLGAGQDAEDVVQDMYMRMYVAIDDVNRIKYGDDINTFYVYRTITSIIYDNHRGQKETPYDFKEISDIDLLDDCDTSRYYQTTNASREYIDRINDMLKQDGQETYKQAEQEQRQQDAMMRVVEDEIERWDWFDNKMFRLYMFTNKSYRQIEKETTISVSCIFNTIKNGKEKIIKRLEKEGLIAKD